MTGLLGTFVNMGTVLLGGSIGLLLGNRFCERISGAMMKALGLCTLLIGITGILKGENQLITIISMALGTLLGEALDLDKRVNSLGDFFQKKLKGKSKSTTISEGFVNASLLFCVGAMSIVGSLQSGLAGDNSMIYTKSLLDFVSSMIFASTLGIGVLFSVICIFVYQGGIVVLAHFLAPLLTDMAIAEMTCTGSLIIIGLSLNLLGVTKLRIMNFIPAIFISCILCLFM